MAKTLQLIRNDLADRLEEFVQGLEPGARLPSERELCARWDCNRVTLRAALRKLIDEGRLVSTQGSGTFLAPPRIDRNLWQFCSFSEAMASAGHALETRLVAFARLEAPKRIAEALEVPLGTPLWKVKRLRVVDGAPLTLETAWLPVELAPELDRYDLERDSLYAVLETCYRIRLTRSCEDLSLAKAPAEDAALLQVDQDADLMMLEGVAFDATGRPVEYSRDLTRGDRCRFLMRVGHPPKGPDLPSGEA